MAVGTTIIGAGVIGCAIAYELVREGAGPVVVIDRGEPAGEASGASAGVLSVGSGRAPRGVLLDLRRRSATMYPEWIAEVEAQARGDVDYRRDGLVELAFTREEAAELEDLVARRAEQGGRVRMLDPEALRAEVPEASRSALAAALFEDDHSVDCPRLVGALCAAARSLGAEFLCGAEVSAVECAGGRVTRVVAGDRTCEVGRLIVAAGAWSGQIGALLGVKVPIRPDKGEMIAYRAPVGLRRTLVWNGGYLVPKGNGEILVGSTSTRGTFDKRVTPESVELLAARAATMVPALRGVAHHRSWSGLRPCPTIRRPIIGPLPALENVIVAAGHHRSGTLLAPITARLVCEIALGRAPSVDLRPFAYKPR